MAPGDTGRSQAMQSQVSLGERIKSHSDLYTGEKND